MNFFNCEPVNGEQSLSTRLKQKVSPAVWDYLKDAVVSSNSDYADDRAMALSFLTPFEHLVDAGVCDDSLLKLTLSNCAMFNRLRGRLKNDDEFFSLWAEHGEELEQWLDERALNKVQVVLKKNKIPYEQWGDLPECFCDAVSVLDLNSLVSILGGIKTGCLANYSWLLDCADPVSVSEPTPMFLLVALYSKLLSLKVKNVDFRLRRVYGLQDCIDWTKVVWLQLVINGNCMKIPLYNFLKDTFSLEWDGGILFPHSVYSDTDCITVCLAEYGKDSEMNCNFDCTLDLNCNEFNPVEMAVQATGWDWKGWQTPFIVSDSYAGYDWSQYRYRESAFLDKYCGKESFCTVTLKFLCSLGRVFIRDKKYDTIILASGSEVSIYNIHDGIMEFLTELKNGGFPKDSKFIYRGM